ncbi:MAG: hypothetical protein ACYC9L_16750 [Sulfuricaulis sp.]
MKSRMVLKKTIIASSVALALGVAINAEAIEVTNVLGLGLGVNLYTDSANMTMLTGAGATVGGTNDVKMVWDGNAYTSSTDYTGPGGPSNITAASTTLFFSHHWTAHDIQVFTPGSYTFDTSLGGGNAESGILSATVPLGDFGVHMLFNWNGNSNIDVFVVAAMSNVFGSGIGRSTQGTPSGGNLCDTGAVKNCLWDGKGFGSAGKPAGNKVWMLASVVNGSSVNGVPGIPMAAGGPFAGFNANFNADMSPLATPVPAAVWLFGSGLLGLFGFAKKRRERE